MNMTQYLEIQLAAANQRWDAATVAILEKQLEFVKARTFDIVYPDMKGRMLIPVSNEVDPGAETITYRQWDEFGEAQVISNYADDLPRVDALVEEFTSRVKSIGSSYDWSIQDLRRSAMAGAQLDTRRARAARRTIENKIEDIAAFGIANSGGITGFFNNANVAVTAAPTGTWSGATAFQILDDMHKVVEDVVVLNKETFLPNTYVIDQANFAIINQKRLSTTGDSGVTVLRSFLDNNPYIDKVETWFKSRLADAGGTGPRHVVYKRDPEVLSLEIPQEFEQLPPQARNLSFVVPVHARVAGVIIYYPIAVGYMDGT